VGTRHIGRHEVGRELDAREVKVESTREGADEDGLAQSGLAFQENVAAGDHRDQGEAHQFLLAHDDPRQLLLDAECHLLEPLGVHGRLRLGGRHLDRLLKYC
jgi:hypothetical protein